MNELHPIFASIHEIEDITFNVYGIKVEDCVISGIYNNLSFSCKLSITDFHVDLSHFINMDNHVKVTVSNKIRTLLGYEPYYEDISMHEQEINDFPKLCQDFADHVKSLFKFAESNSLSPDQFKRFRINYIKDFKNFDTFHDLFFHVGYILSESTEQDIMDHLEEYYSK